MRTREHTVYVALRPEHSPLFGQDLVIIQIRLPGAAEGGGVAVGPAIACFIGMTYTPTVMIQNDYRATGQTLGIRRPCSCALVLRAIMKASTAVKGIALHALAAPPDTSG